MSKPKNPQVAKWISVDDQLPENGQYVLCAYDDLMDYWGQLQNDDHNGNGVPLELHKGYLVRQLKPIDGGRWADEGVTHWMPLPEPPPTEDAMLAKRSKSDDIPNI